MYWCYNCNCLHKEGSIYFAHDRCFCSSFCRDAFISTKNFDKNNISWKQTPTKIESSALIYPFPSIKSTKSILKGLDNIEKSSSKSKFIDYDNEYNIINNNNYECFNNNFEYFNNNSEYFNNQDYNYSSFTQYITS